MTTRCGSASTVPAFVLATLGAACTSPVSVTHDPPSAERAQRALQQVGIAAEVRVDGHGRSTVWVPRLDAERALRRLGEAPSPSSERSERAFGNLVPTRRQAQHDADVELGRSIANTLDALDDVAGARVLLGAAPSPDLAARGQTSRGATVVIEPRDGSVDAERIRRIVSSTAPGVVPSRVEVVSSAPASALSAPEAARFGPVSVPATARGTLRWMFGGLVALDLLTLACLLYFYRRARNATPTEPRR